MRSALSINSWPKSFDNRFANASKYGPSSGASCKIIRCAPPETSRNTNPIAGSAMAKRRITSLIAWVSARSLRINFKRAGVAKKRSRSSTTVPALSAAGFTADCTLPATVISAPSWPAARLIMESLPTAPNDGRASPLNPKLSIFSRSLPSIFDVAWRDRAKGRSSGAMP